MTKSSRKARRAATSTSVVIYVRVSTEEQAKSGAGIDGQIAECRAYADRNGLTVVDVVVEDAVSGKTLPSNRPGFRRALALLDGCDACALLVRRTDRISRNLRHTLAVIDAAKYSGWGIVTTDGKLDTTSAAGQLQVQVMAAVAEYERNVIGERTREALASRKAAGMILGNRPELDAAVVGRIVVESLAGRSLGQIAAGLSADGIQAARGGPFTRSGVQAVLSSERVAAGRF